MLALKPELFGKMQNSDTAQWRGAFDALIHGEANRKETAHLGGTEFGN